LKIGASGLFGALAARYLSPLSALAQPSKARACILVWLNGGPSHIDTFDPKKGNGPFKAIKTSAPGIMLAEHLPRLAEQAHRFALLRGMTSKEGNHQRAQYYVHTGYAPNPTVEHPSLGSWVSSRLGEANAELPAFVSLGGPSLGPGFLGVQHGPFVMQKAGGLPGNVGLAPGVDDQRFARRKSALDMMEARFAAETHDPKVDGRRAVYDKAVKMMGSSRLKTFDIASEPTAVLNAYGDTDFGRACLLARRLVEQGGVKLVEVVLDGWDTHKDIGTRVKNLSTTLDAGLSTLIKELDERKLLDSTLVMCMGEFGRTPRINGDDGRDHYPQAWSALLAGGGLKRGIVHGETDDQGAKVVKNPVTVPSLLATAVSLLGIDPNHTQQTPLGRPISITDYGTPIKDILL
jgi:uncharacterized protein (DUF1501 family)